MTGEEVTAFALSLPEAYEDHPFGFTPDVYKVVGRVFALLRGETENPFVSLKCHPDLALDLRERHPEVTPGWHLNKKHWNSVALDGTLTDDHLRQMIRHSYEQVIAKEPREIRMRIQQRLDRTRSE